MSCGSGQYSDLSVSADQKSYVSAPSRMVGTVSNCAYAFAVKKYITAILLASIETYRI